MNIVKKKIISAILVCSMMLSIFAGTGTAAYASSAWDGTSIDISWFSPEQSEYHISTGAQLAGLAALVNGIYNSGCSVVAGDESYIKDNSGTADSSGPNGNNQSTADYHYGEYNFAGKTIYLDADIDMSVGNYMPIGGQYLMTKNDYSTKISASFCGTLDGRGHTVTVKCDRHCSTGNYGDGSAVGIVGRLGVHDNDTVPSGAPAVRNLIVRGYISANRSVGGVVGKIGRTASGALIENCANYASVNNTDAKGIGGIVGAAWNGGAIRNCFNAGSISSTYRCPAGGIAGSNEITIENCYNIGRVTAAEPSYEMAIGTNNGGAASVTNCYWLENTAAGGGYYSAGSTANGSEVKTADEMKSTEFAKLMGSAFEADTGNINGGYPVLGIMVNKPSGGGSIGGGGGTAIDTKAQELSAAKAAAASSLEAWLEKKNDYYDEQKSALVDLVTLGIFDIEKAKSADEIEKLLNSLTDEYKKIKTKTQIDTEKAENEKVKLEKTKSAIAAVSLKTSSKKTSKGNIRISVKADVSPITELGYTVKYKYYRSLKKSSGYKVVKTTSSKSFTDSKIKKGKRYYYKVKVYVYEGGKLIGKTELKQSTYTSKKK